MSNLIRKIVRKSDFAFYCILYLLSAKKRKAMYTVCAFEKHIRDIIESNTDVSAKLDVLNAWNSELDRIYINHQPSSEIGMAMLDICRAFALSKDDFLSSVNAAKSCLLQPQAFIGDEDYENFCIKNSGSFIKQVLKVLGCRDEKLITDLSRSLGKAVQTTLILRDMKDDAFAGKNYIPSVYLRNAGIDSENPQEIIVHNNLSKARCDLGKTAENNYTEALSLIKNLDRKTAFRIKAFICIYKYLFDVMEKRGWEVVVPKPDISGFTKFKLLLQAYMEK